MNVQTVGWLIFLSLTKKFSYGTETKNPFELQNTVEATEGSCIEIKCNISQQPSGVKFSSDENDIHWFWMKNAEWDKTTMDFNGTVIYSSDTIKRPVSPEYQDRVEYAGSSSWGKKGQFCSILIQNVTKTDSGNYSLRYVGSEKWFTKTETNLIVHKNPCPITFEKLSQVKENDTVTLTCSTPNSCSSKPQIEDMTQPHNPTIKTLESAQPTRQIVTFTANQMDDGRVFSCHIIDRCMAQNISIVVEYAPKNTLAEVNPEHIIKGQNLILNCSAQGRPDPTYTWFRHDSKIHQGNIWVISSINASQSGEYFCQAQNRHGNSRSKPFNINVTYAPEVEIMMTPNISKIVKGDKITLTCKVKKSNPNPSYYTWFKDDRLIRRGPTYDFQSIEPKDSGSYRCEANNTAGCGKSKPFQIEVQYSPQKTNIISDTGDLVKAGDNLRFRCNTDANPEPHKYTWYRYSKDKQSDSLQRTFSTTPSLNFTVNRTHEAYYSCNATNSIGTGEGSNSIFITILYPPTNLRLTMDTEVTEGELITISCVVESFPPSTLTLIKTSSARPSEWYKTKPYDDGHNNIFSYQFNVTSAHAGFYICYANNSIGKEKSEKRQLVVKYTPQNVIAKAQPDLEVMENNSLTLDCSAQSHPEVTSFTWMKVIDGKDVVVRTTQFFTVKSVTLSDDGLYSCTATNELGSGKSQQIEVKVKYGPKQTTITRTAELQLEGGARAVKLSCSSHSYPKVKEYAWYMKEYDNQEYVHISSEQNHTVYSTSPGIYYCTAKNEINMRMSDPVKLFLDSGLTKILIFILFLFFLIIAVVLIIRRRNKRIQQVSSNRLSGWTCFSFLVWWNGNIRRNMVNEHGLARPSRSRDDLLPESRPEHQPCQPHPDRTAASNVNTVYSILNLPAKQGPSTQNPNRTEKNTDACNKTVLHFGNKKKQSETDMYAMVSKPKLPKKNKQETTEVYENLGKAKVAKYPNPLNHDTDTSEEEGEVNYSQVTFNTKQNKKEKVEVYENLGKAKATKSPNPPNRDTDTSEDEEELNYTKVTFRAKQGHQRTITYNSSSDEDYTTQYTEVKV